MTKEQFDNTNRGALFKVKDKQSDRHADYRGECNAGGVDFWIDGWINTSKKSGLRFISFRLKPKNPPAAKPELDDEIPF
jgi:hypothetical protein